MAELTAFCYRSGQTLVHRLDPRFKILFLILLSLAGAQASARGLALLTAFEALMIMAVRPPLKTALSELRYFLLVLALVLVARALTTPGLVVWSWHFLTITREGLAQGLLVCWRLALVVLSGLILVLTTRSSDIRAAVEWFLKPVPWIPEKEVSMMMGLVVRFIPLIFEQAHETDMARRARGVEQCRRPVNRLKSLALPLARRVFEDADKLVLAMEARCYGPDRTDPGLAARGSDWLALTAVGAAAAAVLLL